MSAIRISDLPVLSELQDRDLIHFQRLVDGVWTDFHTDVATLQGGVRTFIQSVDLSVTDTFNVYTPAVNELVVPIAAWAIVDDGATGAGFSILVIDEFLLSGNAIEVSSLAAVSPSKYCLMLVEGLGNFTSLSSSLTITFNATSTTGTGTVYVQYAVLPKV